MDALPGLRAAAAFRLAAALLALSALPGCGRERAREPRAVRADSAASAVEAPAVLTLPARPLPAGAPSPPPALMAVAPRREALGVPLPPAEPAEVPPAKETPAAPDDALKPPILRTGAAVAWPDRTPANAVIELDVRVDEQGDVSDALWAAGDGDSARVAAAVDAALAQRFWPALQHGHAVAVWCRQRFARSGEGMPAR